jgi:hypothetical protein
MLVILKSIHFPGVNGTAHQVYSMEISGTKTEKEGKGVNFLLNVVFLNLPKGYLESLVSGL